MLNQSAQHMALQGLNRGVCAPGMRQSVDDAGTLRCVRQLSYPDATNLEIQDPGAGTDHERYCGKWLDAGTIAYGVQKWAFFDEAETEAAVSPDTVQANLDRVAQRKGASTAPATRFERAGPSDGRTRSTTPNETCRTRARFVKSKKNLCLARRHAGKLYTAAPVRAVSWSASYSP